MYACVTHRHTHVTHAYMQNLQRQKGSIGSPRTRTTIWVLGIKPGWFSHHILQHMLGADL